MKLHETCMMMVFGTRCVSIVNENLNSLVKIKGGVNAKM